MNQKGISHLLLIAAVGIIATLIFTSFAPFRDKFLGSLFPKQFGYAATTADWYMPGANPERTSWVSEEVPGTLKPQWYKKIDPYIAQKIQPILVNDTIYLSTSKGLYAFDTVSTNLKWIYCTENQTVTSQACADTELPLGHSPTFDNGILYVGGLDRKVHAINANTGSKIWTFDNAIAAYETNPVVVNNTVYLGNRDGGFYAIDAGNGSQKWKYQASGPIRFSASYKNNTLYFASDDGYAYALDATNGSLKWQSQRLGGLGFQTFWPVIYTDPQTQKDYVIFSGSRGYKAGGGPNSGGVLDAVFHLEDQDIHPTREANPVNQPLWQQGQTAGPWVSGSITLDTSKGTTFPNGSVKSASQYFEEKPYRRTVFVLDTVNGSEFSYDSNGNGLKEYAPILWAGTHSGTRYPGVVGSDKAFYTFAPHLTGGGFIYSAGLLGWKFGTPFINIPSDYRFAGDEPLALSGGGKLIYWKLCCERQAGSVDISVPNVGINPDSPSGSGDQIFYGYGFSQSFPEYKNSGWEFSQGQHGTDQSPLIPYKGKVYQIYHNTIMALSANGNLNYPPEGPQPNFPNFQPANVYHSVNTSISANSTNWPSIIQQTDYWMGPRGCCGEDDPKYYELLKVAGSDTVNPSALTTDTAKNQSSQLNFTFNTNQTLSSYISKRSPSVLFNNTSSGGMYNLTGSFSHLAYMSSTGVKVLANTGSFSGNDMTESWILLWKDNNIIRFMPALLSLQKKPSSVNFSAAGLKLSYPLTPGYLSAIPFNGLANPNVSQAASWNSSLPAAVLSRARMLNQVSKSHPIDVTEGFSENPASGDVTETFNYTYIDITDDWGTQGIKVAFLPPELALASWNGSPITVAGSVLDLQYTTAMGRIMGPQNTSTATVALPEILNYWKQPNLVTPPTIQAGDPVLARLNSEIDKMIAVGHLKPGYRAAGIHYDQFGERFSDYFSNPGETFYTLLRAYPLLDANRQNQVKTYLQNEYTNFPPHTYHHVGWKDGVSRDSYDYPADLVTAMSNFNKVDNNFCCWGGSKWAYPINAYALSQYVDVMGGAGSVYPLIKNKRESIDYNNFGANSYSGRLDAIIAQDMGLLKLGTAANEPTSTLDTYKKDLVKNLILRAAISKNPQNLKDAGFEYGGFNYTINKLIDSPQRKFVDFKPPSQAGSYGDWDKDSRDFLILWFTTDYLNMVPQLGNFMQDYVKNETIEAVKKLNLRTPYWSIGFTEGFTEEGTLATPYDQIGQFQARAMILGQSRGELERYLDVPAFERGDLYHIQNLVSTLYAPGTSTLPTPTPTPTISPTPTPTPTTKPGDFNGDGSVGVVDLSNLLSKWGTTDSQADLNHNGVVDVGDLSTLLTNWG